MNKRFYKRIVAAALAVAVGASAIGLCATDVHAEESAVVYPDGGQTKHVRVIDRLPDKVEDSKYQYKDYGASSIQLNDVLFGFADNPVGTPDYLGGFYEKDGSFSFGLSSYARREASAQKDAGEAVASMPAVLSALMMGIDKTEETWDTGTYDFVEMLNVFFNEEYGMVLNNPGAKPDCEFWYMLYPQTLYARIYDQIKDKPDYPNAQVMADNILRMADNYVEALPYFTDENGEPNFDYTYFDFDAMKPVVRGQTEAPNHAIAFILYAAYQISGEQKYLNAVREYMDWIDGFKYNPYYEVMTDFGPSMAAILNFKYGTTYDVENAFNQLADGDGRVRSNWGFLSGEWNGYPVDGLVGSSTDHGGYGFQMNALHVGGNLATTAKYDPRFSTAVGKWFLNVTNSARAYFPLEMSSELQSSSEMLKRDELKQLVNENGRSFVTDPMGALGYEGLMKDWLGKTPFAVGDAWRGGGSGSFNNGCVDFSVYGSSAVGIWGAAVSSTDVEQILQIDLNANDAFADSNYPQYLYYNPYDTVQTITVDFPEKSVLFDVNTKTVIDENAGAGTKLTIPALASINVVVLPVKSEIRHEGPYYMFENTLIARDTASVSILSPNVQGQNVSGNVPFKLAFDAPETIQNMTVAAKNLTTDEKQIVYSGTAVNMYTLDTTQLANVVYEIEVEITTINNLTDRSKVKVSVYNDNVQDDGELVYAWNAWEIANLGSAPTMTSTKEILSNGYTRVTGTYEVMDGDKGTGVILGAASTGEISIDFNRKPKLVLDIGEVSHSWLVTAQFPEYAYFNPADRPSGIWSNDQSERLNSDTNETGHIVIDLESFVEKNKEKIDFSSPNTVQLYLMVANAPGCYVDVKNWKVLYTDDSSVEYQVAKSWTAEEISAFRGGMQSSCVGSAELAEDGWARIICADTQSGWGATVCSDNFDIDFSRKPILKFDIRNVTNEWCMRYRPEGAANDGIVILNDTNQTGSFSFNLSEILAGKVTDETQRGHLILFTTGSKTSSFEIKNLQILYPPREELVAKDVTYTAGNIIDHTTPTPVDSAQTFESGRLALVPANGDSWTEAKMITPVTIDYARSPKLTVNVAEVQSKYAIRFYCPGKGLNEVYMIADYEENGKPGVATYDINENLIKRIGQDTFNTLTAEDEVYLSILVEGGSPLSYIAVDSMVLAYPDDESVAFEFNAEQIIENFKSERSKYECVNKVAHVTPTPGRDWGSVTTEPFVLDFDKDIEFTIDVKTVSKFWDAKLKFADGTVMGLFGDNGETGLRTISDLTERAHAMNIYGSQEVKLMLFVSDNINRDQGYVDFGGFSFMHKETPLPEYELSMDVLLKAVTIGEELQLNPITVLPTGFTWTSDRPEIAVVDNNGKVKAVGLGTARITAVTEDGLERVDCIIAVFPEDVEENTWFILSGVVNGGEHGKLEIPEVVKAGETVFFECVPDTDYTVTIKVYETETQTAVAFDKTTVEGKTGYAFIPTVDTTVEVTWTKKEIQPETKPEEKPEENKPDSETAPVTQGTSDEQSNGEQTNQNVNGAQTGDRTMWLPLVMILLLNGSLFVILQRKRMR